MSHWLTRDMPVYKVYLAFLGVLLLLCFIGSVLQPRSSLEKRARIIGVRSNERMIATVLTEQAVRAGGLKNLDQQFVLKSLFVENQYQIRLKTNSAGEVVDIWQTPYRITLAGPTNFVIRSAGPDREFGNNDDIVFNSVSNNFVRP